MNSWRSPKHGGKPTMLEAICMYFGGEIVSAADCDYETARSLGLICPFCKSAVFVRSESTRKVKSRVQLVRPYFAHYPTGSEQNWDCEKRSHTVQGREHLEQLKIQARNQRLRLYNAHLWGMFSDAHGIKPQHLNRVRSAVGEQWCEQTSILVRHEWSKALSDAYTYIDAAVQDIQARVNSGDHYLMRCDLRLHQAICYEIIDFLATDSAGFVFAKLFKFAALQTLASKPDDWGVQEIKRLSPICYISAIAIAIAGTSWIDQIRERLPREDL